MHVRYIYFFKIHFLKGKKNYKIRHVVVACLRIRWRNNLMKTDRWAIRKTVLCEEFWFEGSPPGTESERERERERAPKPDRRQPRVFSQGIIVLPQFSFCGFIIFVGLVKRIEPWQGSGFEGSEEANCAVDRYVFHKNLEV